MVVGPGPQLVGAMVGGSGPEPRSRPSTKIFPGCFELGACLLSVGQVGWLQVLSTFQGIATWELGYCLLLSSQLESVIGGVQNWGPACP
jgi:hypothetical protein